MFTLLVAYVASLIPNMRHRSEWKRTAITLQSLPHHRLHAAVQAFKRERSVTNDTVPLRDLGSGGYLRTEISLVANDATMQVVWIRVHADDGSDIVLKADGSVQKITKP